MESAKGTDVVQSLFYHSALTSNSQQDWEIAAGSWFAFVKFNREAVTGSCSLLVTRDQRAFHVIVL